MAAASPPITPCLHNSPPQGSSRSAPARADSALDVAGTPWQPEQPHASKETPLDLGEPADLNLLYNQAQCEGNCASLAVICHGTGRCGAAMPPNQSKGRTSTASRALHKPQAPQEQLLGASSGPSCSSLAGLASLLLLTNGGPSSATRARSTRPQRTHAAGGTATVQYCCSLIQRCRLQGPPCPFLLD